MDALRSLAIDGAGDPGAKPPRDVGAARAGVFRTDIGLPWLIGLRWGVSGAALAAIVLLARLTALRPPTAEILAVAAATAVTNLMLVAARRRGRPIPPRTCGTIFLLDVVLLTVLLAATGGPSNPLSVLYLAYVNLAAVLLGARWTWPLALLSIVAYASLFVVTRPIHAEAVLHAPVFGAHAHSVHLVGMWAAFSGTAALTAYFVTKLSEAVTRQEREVADAEARASRSERVASLTTLAAGAAHELGSPLATIAVAASELEHRLGERPAGGDDPLLREDARLIRAEVDRCRSILDRLAVDAGALDGGPPEELALVALARDLRAELPAERASRVDVDVERPEARLRAPRRALLTILANLVRNALDASAPGGRVAVALRTGGGALQATVRDAGPGMSPAVLSRAFDPFFSTKAAGTGMGLGLFLARVLAERIGGTLELRSAAGEGTTALLRVPEVCGTGAAGGADGRA